MGLEPVFKRQYMKSFQALMLVFIVTLLLMFGVNRPLVIMVNI